MQQETITLVIASIAIAISLASLIRTRKTEREYAARQERSEQREYRDAVRDYLFISARYEMIAHSIAARANDLIRGRSVILGELARANIPDHIKIEVVRNLVQLDEPLNAVQKIRDHYAAVFQGIKELEHLVASGGPISHQVHEKVVSTSSSFERQALDLKERAEAVLAPLEQRFQGYLDDLTNTALAARTRQ
jgi:hypothetical protein